MNLWTYLLITTTADFLWINDSIPSRIEPTFRSLPFSEPTPSSLRLSTSPSIKLLPLLNCYVLLYSYIWVQTQKQRSIIIVILWIVRMISMDVFVCHYRLSSIYSLIVIKSSIFTSFALGLILIKVITFIFILILVFACYLLFIGRSICFLLSIILYLL